MTTNVATDLNMNFTALKWQVLSKVQGDAISATIKNIQAVAVSLNEVDSISEETMLDI